MIQIPRYLRVHVSYFLNFDSPLLSLKRIFSPFEVADLHIAPPPHTHTSHKWYFVLVFFGFDLPLFVVHRFEFDASEKADPSQYILFREAVVSTPNEDESDLTEDDLKAIAKEQMNSQVLQSNCFGYLKI